MERAKEIVTIIKWFSLEYCSILQFFRINFFAQRINGSKHFPVTLNTENTFFQFVQTLVIVNLWRYIKKRTLRSPVKKLLHLRKFQSSLIIYSSKDM